MASKRVGRGLPPDRTLVRFKIVSQTNPCPHVDRQPLNDDPGMSRGPDTCIMIDLEISGPRVVAMTIVEALEKRVEAVSMKGL